MSENGKNVTPHLGDFEFVGFYRGDVNCDELGFVGIIDMAEREGFEPSLGLTLLTV